MTTKAKSYLAAVIAAGAAALLLGLWPGTVSYGTRFWILPLVALLASLLKMKLPGMPATYSPSSLVLLYGVFSDQLPASLVGACLAATAPSLFRFKRKINWLQVSFNIANLALSCGLSYLAAQTLRHFVLFEPAILALSACVYFTVNIALTSGVVSLTGDLTFATAASEWYVWSAPYFLLGVTLVGLIATASPQLEAICWLIPIPLLYLLHFFSSLAGSPQAQGTRLGNPSQLPPRATVYVYGVIASGLVLAILCGAQWQPEDPLKLAAFAAVTVAVSLLKVRLPGMTGNISLNFVLLLVAAAELSIPELALLGAVAALTQSLWHAKRPPLAVQVAFNSACLMLSAALARLAFLAAAELTPNSALASLIPAMLTLYFTNTLLVAVVLCLVEDKPFTNAWQQCNFWALPYYLVGTTAAALMISAGHATGWYTSLLLLPAITMVFASYNLHVSRLPVTQTVTQTAGS